MTFQNYLVILISTNCFSGDESKLRSRFERVHKMSVLDRGWGAGGLRMFDTVSAHVYSQSRRINILFSAR